MQFTVTCPNCKNTNLYVSQEGFNSTSFYLPGLNTLGMLPPTFCIVVCIDCGLARFFANDNAVAQIPKSRSWYKLTSVRRIRKNQKES